MTRAEFFHTLGLGVLSLPMLAKVVSEGPTKRKGFRVIAELERAPEALTFAKLQELKRYMDGAFAPSPSRHCMMYFDSRKSLDDFAAMVAENLDVDTGGENLAVTPKKIGRSKFF